jgi:hypothetical protein
MEQEPDARDYDATERAMIAAGRLHDARVRWHRRNDPIKAREYNNERSSQA